MKKKNNSKRYSLAPRCDQDAGMGEVAPVEHHHNAECASTKASIYQSELDYISRCILDYPNVETGGQLLGFWTPGGDPVVTYVIGPGNRAQHNVTSFIQDQEYLQTVGRAIYQNYRLQHIGEWHSHHQLGLTQPSRGDVDTMQYGVGKPGFPRLLLCIGTLDGQRTTVNAYNFHENMPRDYVHAGWDIIPTASPYRKVIDKRLQHILIHPMHNCASHGPHFTYQSINRQSHRGHWLTERVENVETMKEFVGIVKDLFCGYNVKVEMLSSGEPVITVRGHGVRIKLPHGFPNKPPVWMPSEDGYPIDVSALNNGAYWDMGEQPLAKTFGNWFLGSIISLENRKQRSSRMM